MTSTIEASDLAKHYGEVAAVDGVSFSVTGGEIFGYLGRNGSGKTTTVRMLTTLTRPTSGSANVAGVDVIANPGLVKGKIGVTMQEAALDPQMTGREHLYFIAGLLGLGKKPTRGDDMLELFGLTEAADRACGKYSGGMQRRLDIATALLGEPEVLFLDEPTTGLDPQSRLALWDEIRSLRNSGTTIFLTTQYLEEADQLADRVAIINKGKIIAEGTPSELKIQHGRRRISYWDAGSNRARTEPTVIELPGDTPETEVLNLIDNLRTQGKPLAGLEVRDTNLEDVFLRLTGSEINATQAQTQLDPVAA